MKWVPDILIVALFLSAPVMAAEAVLGQKAPDWEVEDWINSEPLQLEELRGKVVLVRFWTGPECPFCRATATSLNEFHEAYADRGLMVLAFYHHKLPIPFNRDDVKRVADKAGFRFPVAVDNGWKNLDRWWLEGENRHWTSVSFLIDKEGVIRHIHPGGSYAQGSSDHEKLKAKIEELLEETPEG